MPRGRPRKSTQPLTIRLNVNTVELLTSINPTLITRDVAKGTTKFRHGALGRYIERLILEDIAKRKAFGAKSEEINLETSDKDLARFLSKGTETGRISGDSENHSNSTEIERERERGSNLGLNQSESTDGSRREDRGTE